MLITLPMSDVDALSATGFAPAYATRKPADTADVQGFTCPAVDLGLDGDGHVRLTYGPRHPDSKAAAKVWRWVDGHGGQGLVKAVAAEGALAACVARARVRLGA